MQKVVLHVSPHLSRDDFSTGWNNNVIGRNYGQVGMLKDESTRSSIALLNFIVICESIGHFIEGGESIRWVANNMVLEELMGTSNKGLEIQII